MENNLLKPQDSKTKAMRYFTVPTLGKKVLSYISTASFYRRGTTLVPHSLPEIIQLDSWARILSLEKTGASLNFKIGLVFLHISLEAQVALNRVKDIMCSGLVQRLPRECKLYQMYSDASAGALGVVLYQIDPIDKNSKHCTYGSRKFYDCELKLSIPCKELLAIVYGLNLWSFYFCGNTIQVLSDCQAWILLKM
jgi:hypothetical protein